VSESCQVLLAIENGEEGRLQLVNGLEEGKYNVGVVSETFPNKMGFSRKLVKNRVNEGDKWKDPREVESAGSERVLGNVLVGSTSDHNLKLGEAGELVVVGADVVDFGGAGGLNSNCLGGPAQRLDRVFVDPNADGGCWVEDGECFGEKNEVGPQFLRTKKGDLPLLGLPSSPSFFAVLENNSEDGGESSQAQSWESFDSSEDVIPEEDMVGTNYMCKKDFSKDQNCSKGGKKKQQPPSLNLTNLPYNKLRKLPRHIQSASRSKNKKKKKSKSGGKHRVMEDVTSYDPISNFEGEVEKFAKGLGVADGFGLEVVLPFHFNERRDKGVGTSGVKHLVEGGGFVVEESPCGSEHQSVCEVGNS
jgi:hypothetical protein